MRNQKAFAGVPLIFEETCFVYPPILGDIITIGYEEFMTFVGLFTLSKEEISDDFYSHPENKEFTAPTPLEFIFINCNNTDTLKAQSFTQKVVDAFYFFTREKIKFLHEMKTILIGEINQGKYITEENYFSFQNLIRESLGKNTIELPDPDEDPRIQRFKAKQRERDRVKAKQEAKSGLDFTSTLPILCLLGSGITPFNIKDLTYAASNMLIRTYQHKDKYETDIRSLQAGADSKKIKPKYWIRNLEEE